jgi:hypothetical protein
MPEAPSGGARATAVSVGTAETVALFIPGSGNSGPANIDQPTISAAMNALIRGVMNVSWGTATAPVMHCRRGNGVAGTIVGNAQNLNVSGSPANIPFTFQDLNNPSPQSGYSITIATATAAATVNEIVGSINDGS